MTGVNTAIHTFHLMGNNQVRLARIKAIGKRSESVGFGQGPYKNQLDLRMAMYSYTFIQNVIMTNTNKLKTVIEPDLIKEI